MYSVLVVNGQPVFHTDGSYVEHFEYILKNYSPLMCDPYCPGYAPEPVCNIDDLQECFEWHSGIVAPVLGIYDAEGNFFDAYIVTSPWYTWDIDKETREAVRNYYINIGVSPEEWEDCTF